MCSTKWLRWQLKGYFIYSVVVVVVISFLFFALLLSLHFGLLVLRCQYFDSFQIIRRELTVWVMGCQLCVYVCACVSLYVLWDHTLVNCFFRESLLCYFERKLSLFRCFLKLEIYIYSWFLHTLNNLFECFMPSLCFYLQS